MSRNEIDAVYHAGYVLFFVGMFLLLTAILAPEIE